MEAKDDKKKQPKVVKLPDTDPKKETHSYMVIDTPFEVDKRYEIIDPIGQGAYGVVVAAKDTALPEARAERRTLSPSRRSLRLLSTASSR